MIMRLLIYLMVIIAVFYISRSILPKSAAGPVNSRRARRSRMVKCGYCKLYITEEEAVGTQNEYYCSDEHKKLAHCDENP